MSVRCIHRRMSAAICARQRSVTGMSLGSAVVPLVLANMVTGSVVSTPSSPATMRSTQGRKPS